jgi:hypothetical protein
VHVGLRQDPLDLRAHGLDRGQHRPANVLYLQRSGGNIPATIELTEERRDVLSECHAFLSQSTQPLSKSASNRSLVRFAIDTVETSTRNALHSLPGWVSWKRRMQREEERGGTTASSSSRAEVRRSQEPCTAWDPTVLPTWHWAARRPGTSAGSAGSRRSSFRRGTPMPACRLAQ